MSVRSLHVRDFSAFAEARLDFVPGINVFIGPNGTGKTHVLKLIYATLETMRRTANGRFAPALQEKLAGVFRPDGDEVGRLARRMQGRKTASVSLMLGQPAMSARFKIHLGKGVLPKSVSPLGAEGRTIKRSVFLPTREVLAMYEGFADAYREKELSFDETYFDAVLALSGSPLKGIIPQAALAKRLRKALGGHVELKGPRFYVKFDTDKNARTEAHLVAEGLRKVASLERLVLNGALQKNGYLFWDEPEANLNPNLIVEIVEILAMLARGGVQIFLSTHDYLLARRLSLATRVAGHPPTRFFGYFRPEGGGPVGVTAGDHLEDLQNNPMIDEFTKLYDLVVAADFEA